MRKVGVDADRWEIEYIDDGTGDRWLLDYPESEQHGGGSPRLRKVSVDRFWTTRSDAGRARHIPLDDPIVHNRNTKHVKG
ncbi:MAG: Imm27 family immunity protein [Chromatiales bacterium]